ncbi:ribonuclease VapC [Azorhizobium oxalatiphilum]|uniref:Ribonuclease VapC n=1 Tax=Azorhizobium oxalatiphilum TaxID=980631 RepID=A0A917C0L3_9HYPH|nr:type II toxin-antitoxin system VapC family toxin [Azorhizobium oxalatiphilum]GGF66229.1 ribonuclease VapC [Azorhizobium oxalatiphilum]
MTGHEPQGYLLDTDVISHFTPGRALPAGTPADLPGWFAHQSERLWLSGISLAEIRAGIERARHTGQPAKAAMLDGWIASLILAYGARILALDIAAAHHTGLLIDRARRGGLPAGFADLAIAGTAAAHGLTVLTRNVRHYAPLGVAFHNPFESLPT